MTTRILPCRGIQSQEQIIILVILSLLELRVDSVDQTLQDHFKYALQNALYTSNTIQKDIMAVVTEWMHQKIVKGVVESSGSFSVIADEAKDCATDASNSTPYC